MIKRLAGNHAVKASIAIFAFLSAALFFIETPVLITILNGAFIGVLIAVGVAYREILWAAVSNRAEYDGPRQFALGVAFLWAGMILSRFYSVLYRSQVDLGWLQSSPMIPISITFAIIGGILQISAPDFGTGLFATRDRKRLWFSCTIGALVGFVVIMFQWVD